jgi:GTP cyclohydrolase I
MKVDRKRAEAALTEFLAALGFDDERLADTPARVTAAYADELLAGYGVDVAQLIESGSEESNGSHDPVLLDGIFASTVCPHHLLVAHGTATVGYLPGKRLLGLGTIARIVRAYSRRLVLQEQIAGDVCQALMEHAGARGAFCRLRLDHACLRARGAREAQADTVTWAGQGELADPDFIRIILAGSSASVGLDSSDGVDTPAPTPSDHADAPGTLEKG